MGELTEERDGSQEGTHDDGPWESRDEGQSGREGRKPCGKVDEGAASVRGLGIKTTDLQANGVGLATPASSPQDNQTFVKLTKPHENVLTTMLQRAPCDERSHGEDQSMAGIEQGGGVDEEPSQQVDEKTTDTENPKMERAGPMRPADSSLNLPVEFQPPRHGLETTQPIRTPHDMGSSGECRGVATSHREAAGDEVEGGEMNDEVRRAHKRVDDEDSRVETSEDETTTVTPDIPQSTPLEGEWIKQASGGSSKPTAHETTSTSTRSTLCDHPDEDAGQTNPPRPTEDPGDATDDDARHPDKPTEPPDDTESARVQDGEERVGARWSRVSEAPRAHARQSGHVAHESADAVVDEEVGEVH